MFCHIVSSSRGKLTLQQSLELANIYLKHAGKTKDPEIALVLCHDTELSLSQAKKASKHRKDQTARKGIANAYLGLGKVLDNQGHHNEAQASYKKAEKWR